MKAGSVRSNQENKLFHLGLSSRNQIRDFSTMLVAMCEQQTATPMVQLSRVNGIGHGVAGLGFWEFPFLWSRAS